MAKNTIILKDHSNVVEEIEANAAITPGMLVEEMSTGKLRAHATADGNCLPMFAIEDSLQGKGIDDAYAQYDPVRVWIPGRGDIVNAILAQGQNVTIGTFVTSNGNGHVKAVEDADTFTEEETAKIIGVVTGAAVNATSAAARVQIRIR